MSITPETRKNIMKKALGTFSVPQQRDTFQGNLSEVFLDSRQNLHKDFLESDSIISLDTSEDANIEYTQESIIEGSQNIDNDVHSQSNFINKEEQMKNAIVELTLENRYLREKVKKLEMTLEEESEFSKRLEQEYQSQVNELLSANHNLMEKLTKLQNYVKAFVKQLE